MTPRYLTLPFVILGVFALSECPLSAGPSPVALVYDMPPQQATIVESHLNSARRELRWLSPLYEGDEVHAENGSANLQINFDDGAIESVTLLPTTTLRISSRIHRTSSRSGWMTWLAAWLGEGYQRRRATAVTRGIRVEEVVALRIPGLVTGEARVVAGQRPLRVAWTGGRAPFKVALRGADMGNIFEMASQDGNSVETPIVSLKPGPDAVLAWFIQDQSAGRPVRGQFKVVDRSELPIATGEEMPNWVSPDIKDTIAAMRLAQVNPRRWSYEAWLSIAPLAARYQPARVFAELIKNGDVPPAAPETFPR